MEFNAIPNDNNRAENFRWMIMKYLVIQSKRMYEWMKAYIEDFVLENGISFLEIVLVFYYGVNKYYE